jgi:hypothetical protein
MAKFYGKIGFSTGLSETAPGVWEDVISEREYSGDVLRILRNTHRNQNDKLNNEISISNSISILGDAYANQNLTSMRYVWWMGVKWDVADISVQYPRLIITLGGYGGAYHGPTPGSA